MILAVELAALEAVGLIRLAQSQPELEYFFRHTLVQEAAYETLVKSDRSALHRAAGEVLEALFPQQAAIELAPVLGRHFAIGGDDARALKYYRAAGAAGGRVYALGEATAHYTAALRAAARLAQRNSSLVDNECWIALYAGLGAALEMSADYEGALARYAELEALAEQRGERSLLLAALMARAKIHATINPAHDPGLAKRLLERALALARDGVDAADRAAEARVLWSMMLLATFSGTDTQQAIRLGEQSLELARQYGLREQMAYSLHDLNYAYGSVGRPDLAEAVLDEARTLWREQGNQVMLADNIANKAIRQILRGQFDAAEASAAEALKIGRSIGNAAAQANGQFMLGYVYLERGEADRAMRVMEQATRIGEQIGHHAAVIAAQTGLALTLSDLGLWEQAFAAAGKALGAAEAFGLWRPWAAAVLARLHAARGELALAADALDEARRELRPSSVQFLSPLQTALAGIELALAQGRAEEALVAAQEGEALIENHGAEFLRAEALWLKGRALLALSRPDAAQSAWEAARMAAEAIGSRRTLWHVLAGLSGLAAARSEQGDARLLLQQAREVLEYIAAHAGSAERAARFLEGEAARRILATEIL